MVVNDPYSFSRFDAFSHTVTQILVTLGAFSNIPTNNLVMPSNIKIVLIGKALGNQAIIFICLLWEMLFY
jgi:hypothetical protein